MAELTRLCRADAVGDGDMRQIEIAAHPDPLALFNVGGTFYLMEDTCTHAYASITQGDIMDGMVFCPLHGGSFRITTGEAVELPCTMPLKTFRVWVDGEDVVTDLSAVGG